MNGRFHWLRRKGYFRLSAYFLPFKVWDGTSNCHIDRFVVGSSFDDVIGLYKFDADLRLLVIEAIDRVEVAFRTSITYNCAHAMGPFGYTSPGNFTPYVPATATTRSSGFDHAYFLRRIESEITQSKEQFVRHYRAKYAMEAHLPIWMVTELMSLGMISKMTEGLTKNLRKRIAKDFGISQSQLISWLETLTYIRNICAHHARLWNRELSLKPELLTEWKAERISNNRIYCVLLILEHIMKYAAPRSRWKDRLMLHIVANSTVSLDAMEFPPRWKELPPWNVSNLV